MKKIFLILFILLNLCSYAQTKVIELFFNYPNGSQCSALCVFNGNNGKSKVKSNSGSCMFDVNYNEDSQSNIIITMSNPSVSGWIAGKYYITPISNFIIFSDADYYNDNNYNLRVKNIAKEKWSETMAQYGFPTRELKVERDGFRWYLVSDNGYVGAENQNGYTIIPLSRKYTYIDYRKFRDNPPFFCVEGSNRKRGACTITGTEVVAPKYGLIVYDDGSFKYKDYSNDYNYKPLNIALNSQGTEAYYTNNSSNGSAAGAIIAGAAIAGAVAGIASNSSSNSGSTKKTGPEPGTRSYKSVEIIDVNYTNGTVFKYASADLKIRNMNSYSVVVRVQCRFSAYEWQSGRYIEEITIPAREIRTVHVIGDTNVNFYDARILSVK